MNKRLKKTSDVSNCQIVGPCSQILVEYFPCMPSHLPPACSLSYAETAWFDPIRLSCLENRVETSPESII